MMKIEIADLNVHRNGYKILDNINIVFESGVHVILGRNGAGKTTFLRAIAGLVPFQGEIKINGMSIRGLKRKELSRLIGYVWQNPYYGFIESSVRDEIEVILRNLGLNGDMYIVEKLVPRHLMNRDPSSLSGGEARRVSIASILVADQPIWLLDEPLSNLDKKGVEDLIDVIRYGRNRGKVILIALHEIYHAYMIGPDTYVVLDSGKLVTSGKWGEIDDHVLTKVGIVSRTELCSICHM
ncbi:MAG: ABC transporter ATP-binding protein [Desulfurococcaceae archaeon]